MTPDPGAGNPAFSAGGSCPSYRPLAHKLKALPLVVAAPSFVVPDTVAANCRFLDGLFPEVALCLFETKACLAYTDRDLPADPSALDLTFNAHLPLDLPWGHGPEAAADAALAVAARVAHLAPRCFVLHPPAAPGELARFVRRWIGAGRAARDLLLENVEGNDLSTLLDEAHGLGLSLCLDLGHMMAYEQHFLLSAVDWDRVRMLHAYAPEGGAGAPGGPARRGSRHRPLTELDEDGRGLLRELVLRLRPDASITLEIFEERGLMRSAELFVQWMARWNPA